MDEKEAFDTQQEALHDAAQSHKPLQHEGPLQRYLAGIAYACSHPHRSAEPAGSDGLDEDDQDASAEADAPSEPPPTGGEPAPRR